MAADRESIYKFRALQRIDELTASDATRQKFYAAALARFAPGQTFDPLGPTAAGIERVQSNGQDALQHFSQHWLNGDYFPNISSTTISDTLRDGFQAAIIEAQHLDRPLNVIWVRSTTDSASTDFRVDHVVGPTAVSVVIVTPSPQGRPGG
jgi:hypothetical protein